MKCPHCSKDIKESLITQEAARISGRKGKRSLTPEHARDLSEKSHAARRLKKEKTNADT